MILSRATTVIDTMPGEEIHERMISGQLDGGGFVYFGGATYRIVEMDRLLRAGVWRWFMREVVDMGAA